MKCLAAWRSQRSLHKPVPSYCEAMGTTGAGDNLQKLCAGSRELGSSAKRTRSCTKRQKPAGRDRGNGERCFPNSTAGTPSCPRSRRAVPFGVQQPALQSTAAVPGNFPVRQISSPRSVSGSPPSFRCIFLLSYLASCRQQAPGQRQQHGRPYHPPCKPASQAPQLSGPGSAGR